jgi:hypothetical protein
VVSRRDDTTGRRSYTDLVRFKQDQPKRPQKSKPDLEDELRPEYELRTLKVIERGPSRKKGKVTPPSGLHRQSTLKRVLWTLAGLSAAVTGGAAFLLFAGIESPRLGRALLGRIGRRLGGNLQAGRFRLHLLKGLRLEDVRFESSEGRLTVTAGELVVHHQPEALLSGKVEVKRLEIRDGAVSGTGFEIRGLDAELSDVVLDPPRLAGDLRAREILLGPLLASEAQGRFEFEDGRVRLEEVRATLRQGDLLLEELDVDLSQDPPGFRVSFGVDPLRTNVLLGLGEKGGFGPGRLAFEGQGAGEARAGQGTLSVEAGRLPASALFSALEKALGRTALSGSAYELFEVSLRLDQDRVTFEPFDLRTSTVVLRFDGWMDLTGPLDVKVAVRAPRDLLSLAGVPPRLLDRVSERGFVTVPLALTGTLDAPRVTLDLDTLMEMGRAVLGREIERQIERGLGKALGKLLGKPEP